MARLRQLRWQILVTHLFVVVVGVVVVLLIAYLAARFILPRSFAESVVTVLNSSETLDAARATEMLIESFQRSLLAALLIAGACALAAGVATSILLSREILRPLRQIAASSQRIAAGHYGERISAPSSDELAQVAQSFNEMAAELARVEQTRVALIGDVSHELRTPLTSLSGFLEGVIDGIFARDDETMVTMLHEVRRMRRLVDDLQTLSRVEAGQFSLQLRAYDVRKSIDDVINQLQPQWQAQGLEVGGRMPADPILVYADPDRVAQILTNLLGNAMAYSAEGGRIDVRATAQGAQVQITVEDFGAGISAEDLPYIFERFFQAERSGPRTSSGSGIGLTISRHLAWAMGGELYATSAGLGQGSMFQLTLPAPGQHQIPV
ncbi:MAG: ATP-binding protein [Candidatus Promineifilaceae bacterium]|nr:ATP-binding protein [Candidatus Promineifilaceae bacterium]